MTESIVTTCFSNIVTANLSAITLHRELPVCHFPGSIEELTADKCETGHWSSTVLFTIPSIPLNQLR